MRFFDVLNRWQAVAVVLVLVLGLSAYLFFFYRPTRTIPPAPVAEQTERTASTTTFEGTARPATEAEKTTRTARADNTLPERGSIPAGQYVTDEFEPAFSFRVGEGWEAAAPETTNLLAITTGPDGGQLVFTTPRMVFDPNNPSQEKEVPAPEGVDEWVSWFRRHPNLATSKPVPVSAGGVSGTLIDTTVPSAPRDYPRGRCDTPCVPLYPVGGRPIDALMGQKDRFVIVGVGGDTVLIDVSASRDKFEGFFPKAKKVLATVEGKGA